MEYVHTPVMLKKVLEYLRPINKNGTVIDANTGEGGHSYAFLSEYPDLNLICIDADSEILEIAKKRLARFKGRVNFVNGWSYDFFNDYPGYFNKPDAILFDLGVSFYHYKVSGKGFTFEKDEFLDMRINSNEGSTAADILAQSSENEIANLLYGNAQERYSRRIASLIVNERQKSPITTTSALADLVYRAVPAQYRHGSIHPATRTFAALRIAVNGELVKLHALLEAALRALNPGGRVGVITFHSTEDRIVKNFFRTMNKNCICPPSAPICKCTQRRSVNILTKKGITPADDEVMRNPPSRSARLRVIEKVTQGEEND